ALKNILIPLPPIELQNKIVNILEQFNDLTNSISLGLPKEIELRKQQYEYYRNKLLTFKQLDK
ncbi:MAG: restriction endonuclease subunit S, partial [Mycoplasmataceae bacterium]|nr:restriction endonuclease subunit S [Mycoplasmataceae bacterium]